VNKLFFFCAVGLPMVLTSACNGGGSSSGACADEKYPAAPAGASDLVYVSAACPAEGADGTEDHPYATLGEAISGAKAGATVLVAAGTYKEQLKITEDLTMLGEVTKGGMGDDASIILQSPQPFAITVGGGAHVTLQGFAVTGASGIGIWAAGGSVNIDSSSVQGTTLDTSSGSSFGYGLLASEDGAIILQDSAVTGSALGGVLFSGAPMTGATANGASGSITASEISHNQGYGVRLDQASSTVTIQGNTLTANVGFGIGVFSSGAIILQNKIAGTTLDANGIGDGIISAANVGANGQPVAIPSSMQAKENVITESDRVGVLCAVGAGGIILQDNTISGSAAKAPFGAGIWLQQTGAVPGNTIVGNTLSANRFVGLGLTGDTGGIILQNNGISGTTLGSTFVGLGQVMIGDGINVFTGASAQITGNTVSQNGRFGLILDAEGIATTIQSNVIEDNDEYGIILQNQPATPPATTGNTFSGNKMGDAETVAAGTFGIDSSNFATQ
jgi:parallel beta-helix repeat protein